MREPEFLGIDPASGDDTVVVTVWFDEEPAYPLDEVVLGKGVRMRTFTPTGEVKRRMIESIKREMESGKMTRCRPL